MDIPYEEIHELIETGALNAARHKLGELLETSPKNETVKYLLSDIDGTIRRHSYEIEISE